MKSIFSLLFVVVLVGCDDGEGVDNLGGGDAKYQISISLQDTFDQEVSIFGFGETIRVYLSIFLNSDSDEVLMFNTAQLYDLYITDANDVEVWRQSDNTVYADVVTEFDLPSRSMLTFRDDLEGYLFTGGGLMPGSYTLHGFWIGYGEEVSASFNVQ